jgi:hypothetical protein
MPLRSTRGSAEEALSFRVTKRSVPPAKNFPEVVCAETALANVLGATYLKGGKCTIANTLFGFPKAFGLATHHLKILQVSACEQ